MASRGYSIVAARRLITAVTSLVVVHRLSCSMACGILLKQGSNPCPPALAGRVLTIGLPGRSLPSRLAQALVGQ